MIFSQCKSPRNIFILVSLVILALATFCIRAWLGFSAIAAQDPLSIVSGDDPVYNLRLIEFTIHNFPAYGWFEPMTLYPTGTLIHWGPLFTWAGALMCMVTGAVSGDALIRTSLFLPPLFAAAMIPLVFLLGRRFEGWKTGLFAALFTAFIGGQYLYKSFYGYLDHHIAEVFFGVLFSLMYIVALQELRPISLKIGKINDISNQIRSAFKDTSGIRRPIIFTVMAGIAYSLGLLLMPTMVLFALVVAFFTLVQFIWDFVVKKDSFYLVFLNTVTFIIAIITFFLAFVIFGPIGEGLRLDLYSIAHPLAYLMLIAATIVLYFIALKLRGKAWYVYPAALAGLTAAILLALFLVAPVFYNTFTNNFVQFFFQSPYWKTIQEARPWTWEEAWTTFGYSWLLMAGGFLFGLYRLFRDERPEMLYVMIWSALITYAAFQHIRYEYFIAVNIALLAGLCMGEVTGYAMKVLPPFFRARQKEEVPAAPAGETGKEREKKGQKAQKAQKIQKHIKHEKSGKASPAVLTSAGALLVVTVVALLFLSQAIPLGIAIATSSPLRMNEDWREALSWLGQNTPDTGIDYFGKYSNGTFHYPPTAYGVMSWWDYGHQITYMAKRIPNANPFQQGIGSETIPGAAPFFITQSEDTAMEIARDLGTRFVMTDIEMDVMKHWAMATWYNSTAGSMPYQSNFMVPDKSGSNLQGVRLNTPEYYQTMVSQLHNFDGSRAEPTTAFYIEYRDPASAGVTWKEDQPLRGVITNAQKLNASAAVALANQFNTAPPEGTHAIAAKEEYDISSPITPVPALRHFRLVHESPTGVFSEGGPNIKYVKVFEIVPGARIKGDGIIDLALVTDTGRQFTYSQESRNGEFIVPYSTQGNPYGVKAVSKYTIRGSGRAIDVPEEAVREGRQIG